jgi:hypothetical protein
MKIGTVALVVRFEGSQVVLLETLSEDTEIEVVEQALQKGDPEPLKRIEQFRENQKAEDETFGDYVEQLLVQPFLRPEIRSHGINWFQSKMRIEKFKKNEAQAAKTIEEYALKLFQDAPDRKEFVLAGPKSKVQVRSFSINKLEEETEAA